jgi:hypothetical protein
MHTWSNLLLGFLLLGGLAAAPEALGPGRALEAASTEPAEALAGPKQTEPGAANPDLPARLRIDADPALAVVQGPCGLVYGLIDSEPARISSEPLGYAPAGEYCLPSTAALLRATPYECEGSRGAATILGFAGSTQHLILAGGGDVASVASVSRADLQPAAGASDVVRRGDSVAMTPGTGHGAALRVSYRCPGGAQEPLEFESPFRQLLFLR